MTRRLLIAAVLIALTGGATLAATEPAAQRAQPESYIPKTLTGIPVKTCVVAVDGKTNCGPPTLGDAAPDSVRLGFAMMSVSGINSSSDKRWSHVVYGVTNKPCENGGTSVAAMLTNPGVADKVRTEIEGAAASQPTMVEKVTVKGLTVYVGHMFGKECVAAFGYPSDGMVVMAVASKDDRDAAKQAIGAMLAAATVKQDK